MEEGRTETGLPPSNCPSSGGATPTAAGAAAAGACDCGGGGGDRASGGGDRTETLQQADSSGNCCCCCCSSSPTAAAQDKTEGKRAPEKQGKEQLLQEFDHNAKTAEAEEERTVGTDILSKENKEEEEEEEERGEGGEEGEEELLDRQLSLLAISTFQAQSENELSIVPGQAVLLLQVLRGEDGEGGERGEGGEEDRDGSENKEEERAQAEEERTTQAEEMKTRQERAVRTESLFIKKKKGLKGWWGYGSSRGKTGIFPIACVEMEEHEKYALEEQLRKEAEMDEIEARRKGKHRYHKSCAITTTTSTTVVMKPYNRQIKDKDERIVRKKKRRTALYLDFLKSKQELSGKSKYGERPPLCIIDDDDYYEDDDEGKTTPSQDERSYDDFYPDEDITDEQGKKQGNKPYQHLKPQQAVDVDDGYDEDDEEGPSKLVGAEESGDYSLLEQEIGEAHILARKQSTVENKATVTKVGLPANDSKGGIVALAKERNISKEHPRRADFEKMTEHLTRHDSWSVISQRERRLMQYLQLMHLKVNEMVDLDEEVKKLRADAVAGNKQKGRENVCVEDFLKQQTSHYEEEEEDEDSRLTVISSSKRLNKVRPKNEKRKHGKTKSSRRGGVAVEGKLEFGSSKPKNGKANDALNVPTLDLTTTETTSSEHSSSIFQDFDDTAAIELFNQKPNKGIDFIIEHGMCRDEPEQIALLLFNCRRLSDVAKGEFLGGKSKRSTATLAAFCRLLDFRDLDLDIAIRKFLYRFRLPGEAQEIDRIMNAFAVEYFAQNKDSQLFKTADTVYVLAFAVIMLNTDAHSPHIVNKMTQEDFVKNNKGINEGENLPSWYLCDLYHRIQCNEIKMEGGLAFPDAIKMGWLYCKSDAFDIASIKDKTRPTKGLFSRKRAGTNRKAEYYSHSSNKLGRKKLKWLPLWFILCEHGALYYFVDVGLEQAEGSIDLSTPRSECGEPTLEEIILASQHDSPKTSSWLQHKSVFKLRIERITSGRQHQPTSLLRSPSSTRRQPSSLPSSPRRHPVGEVLLSPRSKTPREVADQERSSSSEGGREGGERKAASASLLASASSSTTSSLFFFACESETEKEKWVKLINRFSGKERK